MTAYEQMLGATSTEQAPWSVIPADKKWFTRVAVAEAIVLALESLDLAFPTVDPDKRKELDEAKRLLAGEDSEVA